MKVKIAVAGVLGLLMTAGIAEAHKVPMGYAKTEIRRETSELCERTRGCVNWAVGPCKRQSFHRIDCVARLVGESGARCAFVVIARAPANEYEVRIHHKRVRCS